MSAIVIQNALFYGQRRASALVIPWCTYNATMALAVIGGVSDNFFWSERDIQLRNITTYVVGRHNVKFGGDVLQRPSRWFRAQQ